MQRMITKTVIAVVAGLGLAGTVVAQDTSKMSVEQRLSRMEQLLNSQGLVDLLLKVESLQTELQRLQGQNEEQLHTLQELKQRQRDLYIDIDRRLLQLERNAPGGAAAAGAAAGSAIGQASSSAAQSTTSAATSGAIITAPTLLEGEQQAYQDAFDLLRELRYDKATVAFRDFLKTYPNGRYAHIAQYWLGEASYAQGDFKQAEAMLKIGYSEYELKNTKAAQASLEQLIKTYPGTTEAGQAQNLLKKIRLKGGN
jgi:TolA-binding protein